MISSYFIPASLEGSCVYKRSSKETRFTYIDCYVSRISYHTGICSLFKNEKFDTIIKVLVIEMGCTKLLLLMINISGTDS